MSYFLLDNPNPRANYYTSRRGNVLAMVLHVTAGLQGAPTGADTSAERTALYASRVTDRQVSWHSGSDRDSNFQLLPDSYTAFHCIGYNSRTVGHEISKTDVLWHDEDPTWVEQTLQQTAACLRPRLKALRIPLRHATARELDGQIARGSAGKPVGLIDHSALDPARRRDVGLDFPWLRLFALLADPLDSPVPAPPEKPAMEVPMILVADPDSATEYLCDVLTKREISPAERDAWLAGGVPFLTDAKLADSRRALLARRTVG